jgi:hypothetical protein
VNSSVFSIAPHPSLFPIRDIRDVIAKKGVFGIFHTRREVVRRVSKTAESPA